MATDVILREGNLGDIGEKVKGKMAAMCVCTPADWAHILDFSYQNNYTWKEARFLPMSTNSTPLGKYPSSRSTSDFANLFEPHRYQLLYLTSLGPLTPWNDKKNCQPTTPVESSFLHVSYCFIQHALNRSASISISRIHPHKDILGFNGKLFAAKFEIEAVPSFIGVAALRLPTFLGTVEFLECDSPGSPDSSSEYTQVCAFVIPPGEILPLPFSPYCFIKRKILRQNPLQRGR